MKTKNNEETIRMYLEKHPNVSADAISEGTGIFKLTVHKLLKDMLNDHILSSDTTKKPISYSLSIKQNYIGAKIEHEEPKGHEPIPETKNDLKVSQERQNKAQEVSKYLYTKGKRDTSKLIFQNKPMGKGPLVLAVVSDFIKKNSKISLQKLKEIFPDTLQPRYGFIVETPRAKRLTVGPKERYFWKAPLTVAGKKVVICSQWSAGSHFENFLDIARKLKYVIK